jgi:hypothetical protein
VQVRLAQQFVLGRRGEDVLLEAGEEVVQVDDVDCVGVSRSARRLGYDFAGHFFLVSSYFLSPVSYFPYCFVNKRNVVLSLTSATVRGAMPIWVDGCGQWRRFTCRVNPNRGVGVKDHGV